LVIGERAIVVEQALVTLTDVPEQVVASRIALEQCIGRVELGERRVEVARLEECLPLSNLPLDLRRRPVELVAIANALPKPVPFWIRGGPVQEPICDLAA